MLDDIKKTLWATADKLRANVDAAEYKHLVLGLIFVKYISDTFTARRADIEARLKDPLDEYFFADATAQDIAAELEDRDYFKAANVFWVPEGARWPSGLRSARSLTTRSPSSRAKTPSSKAFWTSATPAPSCPTASSASWSI